MKYFFCILFVFASYVSTYSQNINEYKYILVPEKYTWSKVADKHQVNSLTKFLFNKYGFKAYLTSDELPIDLQSEDCNFLKADVLEDSSILATTLTVTLKNCTDDIIFMSQKGKSKDKDFKKSYHKALRNAFNSIEELKYSYVGDDKVTKESVAPIKETPKNDVAKKEAEPTFKSPKVKENNVAVPINKIESTQTYISSDGFYSVRKDASTLTIYEGTKEIGNAQASKSGVYLVKTSQFDGIGRFENNQFIIDREIKGVKGLVQMIFDLQ